MKSDLNQVEAELGDDLFKDISDFAYRIPLTTNYDQIMQALEKHEIVPTLIDDLDDILNDAIIYTVDHNGTHRDFCTRLSQFTEELASDTGITREEITAAIELMKHD